MKIGKDINGSGSGRPKNMRILRIRFQILIPNTEENITDDEINVKMDKINQVALVL
jgi:hypothetical protein